MCVCVCVCVLELIHHRLREREKEHDEGVTKKKLYLHSGFGTGPRSQGSCQDVGQCLGNRWKLFLFKKKIHYIWFLVRLRILSWKKKKKGDNCKERKKYICPTRTEYKINCWKKKIWTCNATHLVGEGKQKNPKKTLFFNRPKYSTDEKIIFSCKSELQKKSAVALVCSEAQQRKKNESGVPRQRERERRGECVKKGKNQNFFLFFEFWWISTISWWGRFRYHVIETAKHQKRLSTSKRFCHPKNPEGHFWKDHNSTNSHFFFFG